MPKAVSRLPRRADTSVASDLSSCGVGAGGLSSDLNSGGLGLGHVSAMARKRSLDNSENIPPFDLDAAAAAATNGGDNKPMVSLLNIAAQQLSQQQRKQRRTVITASSPGGHRRTAANPRRAAHLTPNSALLQGLQMPAHHHSQKQSTTPVLSASTKTSSNSERSLQTPQTLPLRPSAPSNGARNGGSSASVRLRRLPKRNLKPLDFSSLHRPSIPAIHSSQSFTAGATSTGNAPTAMAKPTAVPHSSSFSMQHHQESAGCPSALSLPVSPAHSSPISASPFDAPILGASPCVDPLKSSAIDSVPDTAQSSVHPTPPNTGPRPRAAFSGLLASAYQRASAKRSSMRTLCFDSASKPLPAATASNEDSEGDGDEDAGLMEYDPVLGPRCPVIGDPRGLFDLHKKGIDKLQREQAERSESKFSEMARTVREAQAAFEAAVTEQASSSTARARTSGRRSAKNQNSTAAGKNKHPSTSSRPISECKYCGKQYKYHSKLASHEQHCSSRLEALLYSADENEQHIIHCVCGPRHDRPVGERDDLPMVQCDNCLMWLHIECVGIDEDNLPDDFYCPRCEEAAEDQDSSHMAAIQFTPRRKAGLGAAAGGIMSPESHRLATLLANVPDDGSETEDEPMNLKTRSQTGSTRVPRSNRVAAVREEALSSDDTMSISDVSEATRFHRQGSSVKKKSRTPIISRMALSETNATPLSPARRRHVRAGANSNQQTVHTDALSSDFLGLPLPESIFSEKAGLAAGSTLSIAPGLCTQQASMDNLSRFLSDQPPQWSLAQLSSMFGGTANGVSASTATGGNSIVSASNATNAGHLISQSSSYFDQTLADLGLNLGSVPTATTNTGAGPGLRINAAGVAGSGNASSQDILGAADTPLSELIDLPVDNEFSALLESIASGNPGADADPYSSLGADDGFNGMLSDDLFLGLNASLPLSASVGHAAGSAASRSGSRLLAGTRNNTSIEHGSSSTITIMHDDSSLGSQDSMGLPAQASAPHSNLPPLARPPPGMPGMVRGARLASNGSKRNTRDL
ncbi:hypothetical protein GGI12_003196 [Dipsacomyces acuminosporus]|nr:hypothetical protein GGI12_003196 [Dipsacomyces acuminosporus]